MIEETMSDDSSHYEVSLTSGQALVAFVLLLLSLGASFAFGLMIGKGQMDERLVVRNEPAVVTEGQPGSSDGRIVELGAASRPEPRKSKAAANPDLRIVEEPMPEDSETPADEGDDSLPPGAAPPAASSRPPSPVQSRPVQATAPAPAGSPVYAQLLSTGDAKTAESLAARLIDQGFTSAYVERGSGPQGMLYRVRVRFGAEPEARAAVDRLKSISKGEIWITR